MATSRVGEEEAAAEGDGAADEDGDGDGDEDGDGDGRDLLAVTPGRAAAGERERDDGPGDISAIVAQPPG